MEISSDFVQIVTKKELCMWSYGISCPLPIRSLSSFSTSTPLVTVYKHAWQTRKKYTYHVISTLNIWIMSLKRGSKSWCQQNWEGYHSPWKMCRHNWSWFVELWWRAEPTWNSFTDAICKGDGDRVFQWWKFLLILYKSSRKKNYACEAMAFLAHYQFVLSPRLAHQLLWSRFINMHGKPGRNIRTMWSLHWTFESCP